MEIGQVLNCLKEMLLQWKYTKRDKVDTIPIGSLFSTSVHFLLFAHSHKRKKKGKCKHTWLDLLQNGSNLVHKLQKSHIQSPNSFQFNTHRESPFSQKCFEFHKKNSIFGCKKTRLMKMKSCLMKTWFGLVKPILLNFLSKTEFVRI